MKLSKFIGCLFGSALLFGLAAVASARNPPPPVSPDSTPVPGKGSAGPAQVQPGHIILDPTSAHVMKLDLAQEGLSLASDPPVSPGDHPIGPTAFQFIKYENFEGAFPNEWAFFDNNGITGGEHLWTDVPCSARTGSWSGWPAGLDGANGVNPCSPDFANYPNQVDSWLVYGPFSLVDTQAAYFTFFLKMVAEKCNPIDLCDFLFWGASTDGFDFYGKFASGTRSGPEGNGYDFDSLDFSNVPLRGNLLGQPQVWVAIVFRSDSTVTFSGPFIDDVSIVYELAPAPTVWYTFLPSIIKTPPLVTPKTNLYVFNNTGDTLSYYRVIGSKLNGAPIPDITCTNISTGETRFCGTLDTGLYDLKFQGIKCSLQARRLLEQGNHTREARCPS